MPRLQDLPQPVLVRIVASVLDDDPALSLPLLTASRTLFKATRALLYSNLVLWDDDRLLLLAAGELDEEGISVGQRKGDCLLSNVVLDKSYAAAVVSLTLAPPKEYEEDASSISPSSSSTTLSSVSDRSVRTNGTSTERPSPLDENALVDLLLRLKRLERLDICLARPPPQTLGRIFGCLPLTTVTVSLQQAEPDQTSQTLPLPFPILPSSLEASQYDLERSRPMRWDGEWLPSLTPSLSTLSLEHLSSEGLKSLARSFPNLRHLKSLTLGHTPYVDDALVSALVEHCRKLRRFVVRNMCGTRLTDKGIKELLENSESLSELDLLEFEGRLSKRCWEKIERVPPAFRSLRMSYSEVGSHHSFVFPILFRLNNSRLNKTVLKAGSSTIWNHFTPCSMLNRSSLSKPFPSHASYPLSPSHRASTPLLLSTS
jgi:hypothetical protein